MGFSLDLLKCYHADNKKRFGRNTDGGYVIVDGFKYDLLLACGIGEELSFEEDFLSLNKGLRCLGFDATLKDTSWIPKEIEFYPLNISSKNTKTTTNLKEIINQHEDIFLKMDIEGSEYEWIDAMERHHLNKIKQIVIEFHSWDKKNPELFRNWKCLEKLTKTHDLVHIHGNNMSKYYYCFDKDGKTIKSAISSKDFFHHMRFFDLIKDQNTLFVPSVFEVTFVPGVFEATFVQKSLRLGCQKLNQEAFPHKYDVRNSNGFPEIVMRHYPYVCNSN